LAHHDFGVHQILGAAKAYKTDFQSMILLRIVFGEMGENWKSRSLFGLRVPLDCTSSLDFSAIEA
jgi:hypothetical protein